MLLSKMWFYSYFKKSEICNCESLLKFFKFENSVYDYVFLWQCRVDAGDKTNGIRLMRRFVIYPKSWEQEITIGSSEIRKIKQILCNYSNQAHILQYIILFVIQAKLINNLSFCSSIWWVIRSLWTLCRHNMWILYSIKLVTLKNCILLNEKKKNLWQTSSIY